MIGTYVDCFLIFFYIIISFFVKKNYCILFYFFHYRFDGTFLDFMFNGNFGPNVVCLYIVLLAPIVMTRNGSALHSIVFIPYISDSFILVG